MYLNIYNYDRVVYTNFYQIYQQYVHIIRIILNIVYNMINQKLCVVYNHAYTLAHIFF